MHPCHTNFKLFFHALSRSSPEGKVLTPSSFISFSHRDSSTRLAGDTQHEPNLETTSVLVFALTSKETGKLEQCVERSLNTTYP